MEKIQEKINGITIPLLNLGKTEGYCEKNTVHLSDYPSLQILLNITSTLLSQHYYKLEIFFQ